MAAVEASITLGPDAASARSAREFVIDVLDHLVPESTAEVVTLLTSELVTNAYLHAQTDTHLTVRVLPHLVRIEVVDGDGHVPVPRDVEPTAAAGRGLLILDALAERWGVDPLDRGGKRVWAEVLASPPAS